MPLSPGYKAAIPADSAGVDTGVVGLSVNLVLAAARGMAHATSTTSAAQVLLRSAFQRIWNFHKILVYEAFDMPYWGCSLPYANQTDDLKFARIRGLAVS